MSERAETGVIEIRTEAGSSYLLEHVEDGSFITRRPAMRKPTGAVEPLRMAGDFTRLPLVSIDDVVEGRPLSYEAVVDGAPTHLVSTAVTSVQGG